MPTSRPLPHRTPATRIAVAATLLAGLLAGCGSTNFPDSSAMASPRSFAAAAGNWKFTSGTAAFAGALTVSGTAVTATLHALNPACAAAAGTITASGTIAESGLLSLTSGSLAGGKLAIAGTLAPDAHSLVAPSVTVTGGACAAPSAASTSLVSRSVPSPLAQQYQPLSGIYSGTFTDSSGATLAVAATLSQPTTPDTNGVYHLTGYATFPNTSCLDAPVITDSVVTGDSIQATYTDQSTGGTVVGNGTFSPDAQTLTITDWILSGCGDDTGNGQLLRQRN